MKEFSSYALSPLREGDIALYRGFGTGMAPILLVAAEETSPVASSGLNTNMLSRENLTPTGLCGQLR
jgi:hypothetical protein